MRTTVTIDDDLYREAKARAAISGQSVGSVIEDALRQFLTPDPASQHRPPTLPVYSSAIQPGVDLSDGSALADILDEGTTFDALH